MNNLENAFYKKKALICFLTAGDPDREKTVEIINAMAENGADIIEIGIPFSDPVAEGEVIQKANMRALEKKVTTDDVFDMIKEAKKTAQVPFVILTYANPVFVYGYREFFEMCSKTGVEGVVIPDMPFEESSEAFETAATYGVSIITLVAPTSGNRTKKLVENSRGFIYLVSSMGVTGARNKVEKNLEENIEKIKKLTKTPVAVGFGISSPEQAGEVAQMADGVIVGSAIVSIIEKEINNPAKHVGDFVGKLKKAMDNR